MNLRFSDLLHFVVRCEILYVLVNVVDERSLIATMTNDQDLEYHLLTT